MASASSSDDETGALASRSPLSIHDLDCQLQQLCTDISSYASAHQHVLGTDKLLRRTEREARLYSCERTYWMRFKFRKIKSLCTLGPYCDCMVVTAGLFMPSLIGFIWQFNCSLIAVQVHEGFACPGCV